MKTPAIRRVLVGLDDTARAPLVLAMATDVAQRFHADLFVLRAVRVEQDFPPAAHAKADRLEPYLLDKARREMEALVRNNALAGREPPIVVVGEPVRLLLEWSERLAADLIVIGSHGFHGIDHLLGTTTGRVAQRAKHHVLVVHDATDDEEEDEGG